MQVKSISVSQVLRIVRKSNNDFYTLEASATVTGEVGAKEKHPEAAAALQEIVDMVVKKDLLSAAGNMKESIASMAGGAGASAKEA